MGTVYLVQANDLTQKKYALKIIHKNSPENFGVNVYAEVQTLQHLRHPNIVSIYEALEDRNNVYIIQDYIDGRTLSELRDDPSTAGLIDEETVILWMIDVADALEYLHSKSIIHRDIKPGNIMIDSDGLARVIDFGLARRLSSVQGVKGSTFGSAPYSPLERLEGEPDSFLTDIYAFGTTFYSLLLRKVPMVKGREVNTLRTNSQSVRPYYMTAYHAMLQDLPQIQSAGVRDLIRGCIEADPKRRIQNFSTVRYRLRSLGQLQQVHQKQQKTARAARRGLACLLIAGILCTSLGIVQMKRDHDHKFDAIIEQANTAYAAGDYQGSWTAATEAVHFDPENEAGYITKYKAETALADEMNDKSAYERLIPEILNDRAEHPALEDNLYVATYLANAYFETGDYDNAISVLADRGDLEDEQLLLLGHAYYANGKTSPAMQVLDRMSENVPQRYYLEGLMTENTDSHYAVECYEKVLAAEDRDLGSGDLRRKALCQIIQIYLNRGEYSNAINRTNEAMEEYPSLRESAKVNIMLLDAYYLAGAYENAVTQADVVIAKYSNANAYAIKASAQENLGDTEDALDTIAEWKEAYPNDPRPHIQRALIYNRRAGHATTDKERRATLPAFIAVYEEERAWLEEHGELNDEFNSMSGPYYSAREILRQMESE